MITDQGTENKLNHLLTTHAGIIANTFNVAGIADVALLVVFPNNIAVIIISILYPLFVFRILYKGSGNISIVNNTQRGRKPMLIIGLFPSLLLLCLNANNHNLLLAGYAIPGGIVLALAPIYFFYKNAFDNTTDAEKSKNLAIAIACLLIYCVAAIVILNCALDPSKLKLYKAEIIDARTETQIKGGKSYYVTLTKWGPHQQSAEYEVSRSMYSECQLHQTITVCVKRGLFFIPWYYYNY